MLSPALAVALLQAVPGEGEGAALPRVELPPGPAAEAWAKVSADQVPARLESNWPPFALAAGAASAGEAQESAADGWSRAEPWQQWAELVRAERGAPLAAPARSAELARVAALQSRSADAWSSFAACGAEPALLTALMPSLLPGVGPECRAGPGGLPLPLADGALLRPSLPPEPMSPDPKRPARCAAGVRGFRVGAAEVSLEITWDPDGVQVDLLHRGGGPASLSVVLPCPPQYVFAAQYANWEQAAVDLGGAHALRLEPGGERQTLWGRFGSGAAGWPLALPSRLPAGARASGIELWPAGSTGPRVAEFARALGLVLEIPVRVRGEPAAKEAEPAPLMAPWRIAIPTGHERERALAALIGQTERFVLGRTGP